MIHNTHMSQFIPPTICHYVTGTWTDAAGSIGNTICKSKAAADNTAIVNVPIHLPSNSIALQGCKVVSIDIYWEVLTAAMDAVSATIYKCTLPVNGADYAAPTSLSFTYDTGHDTAPERLTLDEHKMTLTLDTPIFLDDDDELLVALSFDAAATSALTFFGGRVNYTFRA